jgi:hypothetical protein
MSTAVASDVLNRTYDKEENDIDDENPNDDQYSSRNGVSTAKLNLNETQVIVVPKKMNITANLNYGDCTNAADTSEIYSYSKSSKYSSLPIIISTNSNQFAKASNAIKNFMERFCVNECYESIFDEKFENIDLE